MLCPQGREVPPIQQSTGYHQLISAVLAWKNPQCYWMLHSVVQLFRISLAILIAQPDCVFTQATYFPPLTVFFFYHIWLKYCLILLHSFLHPSPNLFTDACLIKGPTSDINLKLP